MVDVLVPSSYGYRLGAVSKWAMDVEDPLSTAINDFPKRGILVRTIIVHVEDKPINVEFPLISSVVPFRLGRGT